MATPILTTKLHIPSLRRNLVARQRLLDLLDQVLHRRVTVVSAPAGFGKTTLLSEWIQSLQTGGSPPPKVAWISLDPGDNDPSRFAAYLVAALGPAGSALRQSGEHAGQAAGDPLEWSRPSLQESHLVTLINQVAALPRDLILVLDDYHLIESQVVHNAVTFLIDHLSENLHLVLATRADPPLPLPRLRARGHLTELRQSDLRFTAEEAAAFLNTAMGLDLSAVDVAALEVRTEGWIAGLQMAALWLQGHSPHTTTRPELIPALTGSHRFILDYLIEEVLDQQPPAIQEFLLKTSILERLSGPLCDSILYDEGVDSPRPDSQSTLEHLEASNLFIVPLDDERCWYRYHRLFSDLLRKRLWQRSPEVVPALHRSASAWHEHQGLTHAAIEHALAAHDFERAASLIERIVEATLMRSEVATFIRWVERLPDERVRSRPTLCFYHAWALTMTGRSMDVVEGRLQDIACGPDVREGTGATAGRLAALRAYLMLLQADVLRAAELGRQALEHLPESDLFLRGVVGWILSLARLSDGDVEDSSQALKEVAREGQEIGNPLIAVTALCYQAKLRARQGGLHRAHEILERALELATDPQGRRLPVASEALMGLGELEREWNHLEVAADHLGQSIELAKQWSELAAFDAYFPLARISLAQGDVEGAREALDSAQRIARRSEATKVDDVIADLQQAYLSVALGDMAGAMRWAEKRGLVRAGSPQVGPAPDEGKDFVGARLRKYEEMVLARLLLLQDRAVEALDLLDSLLALARQLGRIDMTLEIQILRALAWQVEGQDGQAMDALAEALSLAEPGGHIRVFADEGEPMARLLRQTASRGISPTYVTDLLAAFQESYLGKMEAEPSHSDAQPLVEPLSRRELEVLRLLSTGMSNPEIAGELVVAVSTVRSHCKSIYGKLNVHRRWDAVQRAQELGLI